MGDEVKDASSTCDRGRLARFADAARKGLRILPIPALLAIFAVKELILPLHYWSKSTSTLPLSEIIGFDWSSVKATKDLEYVSCYGQLQCTRLKLPMNWANASEGDIGLAVIRQAAQVPIDDPSHGGMIVVNPGGPGGSGIDFVVQAGRALTFLTDTTATKNHRGKYFDLVSFDPRGVGFTSPPLQKCFRDQATRHSYYLRMNDNGLINSSDVAFPQLWAFFQAEQPGCEPVEAPPIRRHLTTPAVARDILALVEKDAFWRTNKLLGAFRRGGKHFSEAELSSPQDAKLKYWGFSYGSILGATFASLFPDRVEHVVLDGTVSYEDYYDVSWENNLLDTEKVMTAFYKSCAEAPQQCPLAENGSTTNDIRESTQSFLESIRQAPLIVSGPTEPTIITYSDVKRAIFISLYSPVELFPWLAKTLSDLRRGFYDEFAYILRKSHEYDCSMSERVGLQDAMRESQLNIICADGADIRHEIYSEAVEYWKRLEALSPSAAAIWATIRPQCSAYRLRPAWRLERKDYGANNTAHPILWVGNTMDPVTPLANAFSQSKLFPGSRVLTNDGPGHCSINAISTCTVQYIKRYFYDGSLPDEGTVCEVEQKPFQDIGAPTRAAVDGNDDYTYSACAKVASGLREAGNGLGLRVALHGSLPSFT